MKILIFTATILNFAWCNFVIALPISAFSGVDVSNNFVVAGGVPLPPELDSRFTAGVFSDFGESELNAPDAIPFEDSAVTIAGFNEANPTIYYQTSSATRNLGVEGAVTSSNHSLYTIRQSSDVTEHAESSEASSLASLSSEVYETLASSFVNSTRRFSFTNNDQNAITFALQGIFEMNIFSLASGANAFTESFALLDLFFESSNSLDIQFADIEPFILNEDSDGAESMVSIDREINVANTGHLSMTGYASASDGDAFGTSRMAYVLGITLQAGETITMAQRTRHTTLAEINLPAQVSSPATFTLILLGIIGLCARRPCKDTYG
ncbi:hypothetical protein [Aliiglaciecola litoralis]|uniref:PEP-CTERM protein-sorting domain-containing protein n=1 Tax=Aliiglaciecola litoralis TaxID=582857 RepID=A0ABP3X5W5_9ALTE